MWSFWYNLRSHISWCTTIWSDHFIRKIYTIEFKFYWLSWNRNQLFLNANAYSIKYFQFWDLDALYCFYEDKQLIYKLGWKCDELNLLIKNLIICFSYIVIMNFLHRIPSSDLSKMIFKKYCFVGLDYLIKLDNVLLIKAH